MREGVSRVSLRKVARAFSTFTQAVFWVRMAPTITSNGVLAGHQFIGPRADAIVRKYSRSVSDGGMSIRARAARTAPDWGMDTGTRCGIAGKRAPLGTIRGQGAVVKTRCGGIATMPWLSGGSRSYWHFQFGSQRATRG